MKHLGQLLKNHIETNHLKKRDVAEAAGITYNYLSTVFNKESIDCALWEKLCAASGLNPASVFDIPAISNKNYSDIQAHTVVGPATVMIAPEQKTFLDLLSEKERIISEKERTIQILMGNVGPSVSGQNRDSHDK